jgi:hypothetical protein
MKTPASMTLLQLAMHVQNLHERPVAWTAFDRAARDEYDERVLALEQKGRAA